MLLLLLFSDRSAHIKGYLVTPDPHARTHAHKQREKERERENIIVKVSGLDETHTCSLEALA